MVKTLGTATHSQHQNFKYSAPFAGNKRVWATVCQPFKFFDQMKTKQKIIKCLKGSYKGTDIFVSLNAGRLRRKPKFENMYLYTIKSIYIIFSKKKFIKSLWLQQWPCGSNSILKISVRLKSIEYFFIVLTKQFTLSRES